MNDPAGIARSKEVALDFIATKLRPEDKVGILSYAIQVGVNVRLNPTTDHAAAAQTVREMKDVTRLRSSDDTYAMNVIDADADTRAEKDSDNEIIIRESSLYCSELESLAQSLRAMDGFKNILFFSRGLSSDIFTGGEIGDPNNYYGMVVFERYQSMLEKMAQASSPIFTINTLGARAPTGKDNMKTLGVDALVGLSKATGGTYFSTPDYVAPLNEKIDVATANYYVLGYRIDFSWDGAFHELKAAVRRPGCEIRMPRGYFNPKQYADFSPREKNDQLLDLAGGKSSPFLVPYDIPLIALPLAPRTAGRDADCLILSDLARPELRELAGPKSEVALLIFNEKQEAVWSQHAEFAFAGMTAANICPYVPASLPSGRYEARIAIRNLETGMAAVGRIAFVSPNPPKPAADPEETRLRLDPPLLLQPGKDTAFFKLSGKESPVGGLSLNAAYPFVSVKSVPVFGLLDAEASPLQAIVRLSVSPPLSEPDLRWSARFVPAAGRPEFAAEATEIVSQSIEGISVFFLDIDRPNLPPGDYLLKIKAGLERSGAGAEIEIPLRVR
jgi:VWFA-related protein